MSAVFNPAPRAMKITSVFKRIYWADIFLLRLLVGASAFLWGGAFLLPSSVFTLPYYNPFRFTGFGHVFSILMMLVGATIVYLTLSRQTERKSRADVVSHVILMCSWSYLAVFSGYTSDVLSAGTFSHSVLAVLSLWIYTRTWR